MASNSSAARALATRPTPAGPARQKRSLHAHAAGDEHAGWRQRYDALLAANGRLQRRLQEQEVAHRRSLTVVKYEPALPNNDVFTKELVEENRALLERLRALELRLAKVDRVRAASVPSSPRRSVDRSSGGVVRKTAKQAAGLPVKLASFQTQDTRGAEGGETHDNALNARDALNTGAKRKQEISAEVLALVAQLKLRLGELDVDLARLQQENELLRAERHHAQENDAFAQNVETYAQLRTREQQQELEHVLGDRVRQMKILEEQFSHLQSKMEAKSLLYRQSLDKVEQLTGELFDAKQTLLKQAEWLHAQEDKNLQLSMLEKEVHVLRRENATLDETVAVLSARPLASLDALLDKKSLQISMLEQENSRLEREHSKASQDHRIVMQTNDKLRGRVADLTSRFEASVAEIQALTLERERCAADREIADLRLQFFLSGESAESNELMEAVGRALKTMKLERDHGGSIPQVHPADAKQVEEAGSVRALQEERHATMAKVAKLIQEDTRAQMQEMRVQHQAEVRRLRRQCVRWEQRATEYLRQLTALETARANATRGERPVPPSPAPSPQAPADRSDDALTNATHSVSSTAAQAAENLLEVRLHDLRLTGNVLKLHAGGPRDLAQDTASCVVFCDYFDFESQHSPVFPADSDAPPLDLEISYKLLVDAAFCRSPLARVLTVELHRLGVSSACVVATSQVSLQSLFMSEHGTASMSVKLAEPTTRVALGTLRIALRLAYPVGHLQKAWRRTADAQQLHTHPRVSHMPSTHQAELGIRVVAMVLTKPVVCTLGSGSKLWYRFMGHPAVRYAVPTPSLRAAYGFCYFGFDQLKVYETPRDGVFIDFLQRYELGVSVETAEATRHNASVPLAAVVQRHCAGRDSTSIVSAVVTSVTTGEAVGRLWFELQVADAKAQPPIGEVDFRQQVVRVFGVGTKVDWRRFCEALAATSAERAVRQMLSASSELLLRILRSTIPSDCDLSTLFDKARLKLSRAELSLISGSLFPCSTGAEMEDDGEEVLRRERTHVHQRLLLLLETADSAWLSMEPIVRAHVELLGVLVAYPTQDAANVELIDWETFQCRVRLVCTQ